MKYHFTEPNNCCNLRDGGLALPFAQSVARAGMLPRSGRGICLDVALAVHHCGDKDHA
jgi:hypothetical protein